MRGLLLVAVLLAPAAPPQALTLEARSVAVGEANEVHVLLRAVDEADRPVAGLTHDQFQVFDDGRPVEDFELRQSHPDGEPVALSLLVDVSGSMSEADVTSAVQGVRVLVQELPPEAPYEVVAFDSDIRIVKGFDDPLDAAALDALRPGSDTVLNDVIAGALERVVAVPASSHAVVVLTDGVDDGSALATDVLLERVRTADVAVHTIGLGEVDPTFLQQVAELSGGRFQQAADGSAIVGLYRTLASGLKTEYRLSFTSSNEPGEHEVVVVLTVGEVSSTVSRPYRLGAAALAAQPTPESETGGLPVSALAGVGLALLVFLFGTTAFVVRRGRTQPPPVLPVPVAPAAGFVGASASSYHLVGAGGIYPIAGRLVLGRDPLADVVVGEETVSRSHAQLEACDGGVRIQDLGSANGTRINGAQIDVDIARPGDLIDFGDLSFELRAPSP